MVNVSSITALILSSIALVQCIPLEARDPPSFETCYGDGIGKGSSPIDTAKQCLSDTPNFTCHELTDDSDKENIDFDNCIFDNKSQIDDQFERALICIEIIKGVTCTDPQPSQ